MVNTLVAQGIIGLMTRFGMEVVLAHQEGYEIMEDVEKLAEANAKEYGGSQENKQHG